MLSNYMAERGANQGSCAHSCRWDYKLKMKLRDGRTEILEVNDSNRDLFEFLLEEGVRPGELMPIFEDEQGSYILNSKDLCLMPHLDDYLALGIDAFKVEGRHKNIYYVASVARAYRRAIDDWKTSPRDWRPDRYMTELQKIQNRGYTLAFHSGRLTHLAHDYDSTESAANWHFAGFVREWKEDGLIFEIRNKLTSGDVLEFVLPHSLDVLHLRLYHFMIDGSGQEVWEISPGQKLAIFIPLISFDRENPTDIKNQLPVGTVARVEELGETERIQWQGRKQSFNSETSSQNIKPTSRPVNIPRHLLKRRSECCLKGCNGCLIYLNKLGGNDPAAHSKSVEQ
jgi:putative protease